jgi:hypothetical protein
MSMGGEWAALPDARLSSIERSQAWTGWALLVALIAYSTVYSLRPPEILTLLITIPVLVAVHFGITWMAFASYGWVMGVTTLLLPPFDLVFLLLAYSRGKYHLRKAGRLGRRKRGRRIERIEPTL